jgi:hypothetical protein
MDGGLLIELECTGVSEWVADGYSVGWYIMRYASRSCM